ncbi:alpha/beta hydrolase [Salinactinospora qingdaonensis]|uniref:alpha/beta hydrolase n=1 Tax=Salinactinospora qingdaonensis TaxID=702744 RepID=UPI0031EF1907
MSFDELTAAENLPEVEYYSARDDAELPYRHYPSSADIAIVLLHGSAYHSSYLAPLASYLARNGVAEVYTPDLRGHGPHAENRGDVAHVGQLEDDIADFADFLRRTTDPSALLLGGHSSGGGTAIRFAGNDGTKPRFDGYVLLAPYIHHTAATYRDSEWTNVNVARMAGLGMLNSVGITAFNHERVISFNMPESYRDGTETLGYSYRLQRSMHPRDDYHSDISGLPAETLVVVGEQDETFTAEAYEPLFARHSEATVRTVGGVSHFGVVREPSAQQVVAEWVTSVAGSPRP